MNKWFAALVGLFVALPAFAQPAGRGPSEATTDPLKVIYRVAGVMDSGSGGNTGIATSFMCTNISPVPENVRFRVYEKSGALAGNFTATLASKETYTASTHLTILVFENHVLSAGVLINQGSAIIWATSAKVICSAMIVDAGAATPTGVALHMVRYTPIANTLE
jgi:hypothetical protein